MSSSKADNIPGGMMMKAYQRHKKVSIIEKEGQTSKVK